MPSPAYPAMLTVSSPRRADGFTAGGAAVRLDLHDMTLNVSTGAFHFPPHQHLEHELIVVETGVYCGRLNGADLTLEPWDVLVVNPGDWHEDLGRPPLRYYAIRFRLRLTSAGEPERLRLLRDDMPPGGQQMRLPESVFRPLLEELWKESESGASCAGPLREALAREFFWRLVRRFPEEQLSPPFQSGSDASRLEARLRRLFEQHLTAPPAVPVLAAALGMSESALAHQCRRLLGVPPARAFTCFRMEHAAELLRHTGMSVKQVAAYLGFRTPYHFSRVFKSVHGRAPARFRATANEVG